ncbi:MAG: hypothetical protein HQM16_04310 [Deltaproteobacteria bacterium]|nr:hypothetical protein [Deltaproteobacteria bacterium]
MSKVYNADDRWAQFGILESTENYIKSGDKKTDEAFNKVGGTLVDSLNKAIGLYKKHIDEDAKFKFYGPQVTDQDEDGYLEIDFGTITLNGEAQNVQGALFLEFIEKEGNGIQLPPALRNLTDFFHTPLDGKRQAAKWSFEGKIDRHSAESAKKYFGTKLSKLEPSQPGYPAALKEVMSEFRTYLVEIAEHGNRKLEVSLPGRPDISEASSLDIARKPDETEIWNCSVYADRAQYIFSGLSNIEAVKTGHIDYENIRADDHVVSLIQFKGGHSFVVDNNTVNVLGEKKPETTTSHLGYPEIDTFEEYLEAAAGNNITPFNGRFTTSVDGKSTQGAHWNEHAVGLLLHQCRQLRFVGGIQGISTPSRDTIVEVAHIINEYIKQDPAHNIDKLMTIDRQFDPDFRYRIPTDVARYLIEGARSESDTLSSIDLAKIALKVIADLTGRTDLDETYKKELAGLEVSAFTIMGTMTKKLDDKETRVDYDAGDVSDESFEKAIALHEKMDAGSLDIYAQITHEVTGVILDYQYNKDSERLYKAAVKILTVAKENPQALRVMAHRLVVDVLTVNEWTSIRPLIYALQNNVELMTQIGSEMLSLRHVDSGKFYLTQAILIHRTHLDANLQMVKALAAEGKTESARVVYDKFLEAFMPANITPSLDFFTDEQRYKIGIMAVKAGDYERGLWLLKGLDPEGFNTHPKKVEELQDLVRPGTSDFDYDLCLCEAYSRILRDDIDKREKLDKELQLTHPKVSDYEHGVEKKKSELTALEAQIKPLQREFDRLDARLSRQQRLSQTETARYQTLDTKIYELKEQKTKVQRTHDNWEEELDGYKFRVSTNTKEITGLSNKLKKHAAEHLKTASDAFARLETALEEIKQCLQEDDISSSDYCGITYPRNTGAHLEFETAQILDLWNGPGDASTRWEEASHYSPFAARFDEMKKNADPVKDDGNPIDYENNPIRDALLWIRDNGVDRAERTKAREQLASEYGIESD